MSFRAVFLASLLASFASVVFWSVLFPVGVSVISWGN